MRTKHSNASRYFENPIDPEFIRVSVLDYFNLSEEGLTKKCRRFVFTYPRYVYTYCLWHYTAMRQEDMALLLNMDRSMISHAISTINGYCASNDNVKKEIIEVEKLIDQ